MGDTIPLIKAYPDEKKPNGVAFSQTSSIKRDIKIFSYTEYFDLDYFVCKSSTLKNKKGVVVLAGTEYPERNLHMTVDNGIVTSITDNYRTMQKESYEEEGSITENEQYTEFLSNRFKIRIYCDQEIKSGNKVTARAEVEYIGPDDKFYFFHADPYFTMSLSGGKYSIGGFINDIGITSVFRKGEKYEFSLRNGGGYSSDDPDADYWAEFYSKPEIILPQGEYTIRGYFEGQNMADGKNFTAKIERKITVK